MTTNATSIFPRTAPLPGPRDNDRRRAWFSLALPAVMAVLLTLVPLIGKLAAVPFMLVLVPLVLWSAFRDTERAVYVYLAWCWMDGTIRGLFGLTPISIIARDIVLGIIVVGWGAQRLQNRFQDPLRCPPGSLLVALFVINCLLQVFNPYTLGLVQDVAGLKLHLSPIPLFFVAYDVFRRPGQLRALFVFLTLAALVIGLVSLVQYAGGRDWTWAHFPGTKEAISQEMHATQEGDSLSATAAFKPPGTTAFGGGTAAYVGLVFPLTFGLLMLSEKNGNKRIIKVTLLGFLMIFVFILLINGLRSALVTGITGLMLSGVIIGGRLRTRMLTGIAVCLVLGLVAFNLSESFSQGGVTERFATTFASPVKAINQDRRTFFDDAGWIIVKSPVGVGLGRMLGGMGHFGSADNSLGFVVYSEAYLGEIMLETGILGGILISAIAISFLLRGCLALAHLRQADDKFLAAATLGVLAVLFANFFFSPILIGPPGSIMFWLLGGLVLRIFVPPTKRKSAED